MNGRHPEGRLRASAYLSLRVGPKDLVLISGEQGLYSCRLNSWYRPASFLIGVHPW
jgi:hypothetical protein